MYITYKYISIYTLCKHKRLDVINQFDTIFKYNLFKNYKYI